MYTTKKVKIEPTPELDALARESGRVYSKVVSLIRKVKKKNFGCLKVQFRSICAFMDTICIRRQSNLSFKPTLTHSRVIFNLSSLTLMPSRPNALVSISRCAGFRMASPSRVVLSGCLMAKAMHLKGIRKRTKFSKKSNQKVHQWAFACLQFMICYKAELAGLNIKLYTSQTCPRCGNRKKPQNRNYHCNHCDFEYHRDGVGAINLWNKVSGFMLNPVVGAMASPIGVRFNPHLCKSG